MNDVTITTCKLAAAAIVALLGNASQAAEPAALIRSAIRGGSAVGTVDGPVADEARNKLNATGPLTLKVTRLYEFQQSDCARVRLTFTQAQALPTDAKRPIDYSWSTDLSICVDGQAPATQTRKRQ